MILIYLAISLGRPTPAQQQQQPWRQHLHHLPRSCLRHAAWKQCDFGLQIVETRSSAMLRHFREKFCPSTTRAVLYKRPAVRVVKGRPLLREFDSRPCVLLGYYLEWMGDRLWAGTPSRYLTSHLGQLSLPSLRGR